MEIPTNSTDYSAFYAPPAEVFKFALNSCGHLWKKASEFPHQFLEFARQIFEMVHQKFFAQESMSDSGMGESQSYEEVTKLMRRTVSHQEIPDSFTDPHCDPREANPPRLAKNALEGMESACSSKNEIKLEEVDPEDAARYLCNSAFLYSEMKEKDYLKLLYDFDNVISRLLSSPDLKEKLIARRALVRSELSIYMPENLYWQNGEMCGIRVTRYSSFGSNETSIIRRNLSNLSDKFQSPILLFSPNRQKELECVEESGLQYHSTAEAALFYYDRKGLQFDVILRSSSVSPGNSMFD